MTRILQQSGMNLFQGEGQAKYEFRAESSFFQSILAK